MSFLSILFFLKCVDLVLFWISFAVINLHLVMVVLVLLACVGIFVVPPFLVCLHCVQLIVIKCENSYLQTILNLSLICKISSISILCH